MTKRKIEYWVIPPDADGEFVAHMEEVLLRKVNGGLFAQESARYYVMRGMFYSLLLSWT